MLHTACAEMVSRRGLQVIRYTWAPAFEGGVKTEFTFVDLDCRTAAGSRAIHRLRVWIFGVRELVSTLPAEKNPEPNENG